MKGRDLFRYFKPVIIFISLIFKIIPKKVFIWCWPILDLMPSYLGLTLRYLFAKRLAKKIGDNVSISRSVEILNWNNLQLGTNVSIHKDCYIDAEGGISIGNDVSIAHASTILSSNHTWNDKSKPIRSNPLKKDAVTISNDVWIGCAVRIMAGVNISSRCIIASGAIVTKDINKETLVAGIPSKLIKKI